MAYSESDHMISLPAPEALVRADTTASYTQLVKVAIKGHQEAYGLHSIASGKEVAARADNLLTYDQMTVMMHR